MIKEIKIAGRKIGPGHPVYIVAEMSANHNQDYDAAVKLFEAVKEAGADAVKIQTYTADTITIACNKPEFRISGGTLWDGKTLHDLYREAHTPWDWQPKLKKVADSLKLDFFSSAFDASAVDFLEEIDVVAHKVASFELVDLPLIERMARTGKPLIISTGMATEEEIEEALKTARASGATAIAMLKCTSAYPAPPEEMNLRRMLYYGERYDVPVGLSDHTLGWTVPVAATALGACIVEKHFTLSRKQPGPDSAFSLEPSEFKAMVQAVRTAEKALGDGRYHLSEKEANARKFRRSLYIVHEIKKGEIFTEENVRSIRPGYGLAPRFLNEILGKKASRDLEKGTPLQMDAVSGQ